MKVKKYAKETRPLSLAQKLQAYKEASLGLTPQQGKTAFAVAASSLAALTPFVAQAQCGTSISPQMVTVTLPLNNAQVFFDYNNDGTNDLVMNRNSDNFTELFPVNGVRLYDAANFTAKKFALNDVITNDNTKFRATSTQNYLCATSFGYTNFCANGVGYLGIKLASGKLGFIKITRNNPGSYTFDRAVSGVSVSTNPASVKAGNCPTLPVELTNFVVKPATQHINLAWSTASEKDNAFFAVERSRNAVDFVTIAQVKGNGTTSAPHDYSFTDNDVTTEGVYYYRLKQVDNDGHVDYSHTISAELKGENKARVYPTVVRRNLVNIEAVNNNLPTAVIDMTGRVLKQFATTPSQIDVSDLGTGVYIVRVGSQVTRIVKYN